MDIYNRKSSLCPGRVRNAAETLKKKTERIKNKNNKKKNGVWPLTGYVSVVLWSTFAANRKLGVAGERVWREYGFHSYLQLNNKTSLALSERLSQNWTFFFQSDQFAQLLFLASK